MIPLPVPEIRQSVAPAFYKDGWHHYVGYTEAQMLAYAAAVRDEALREALAPQPPVMLPMTCPNSTRSDCAMFGAPVAVQPTKEKP